MISSIRAASVAIVSRSSVARHFIDRAYFRFETSLVCVQVVRSHCRTSQQTGTTKPLKASTPLFEGRKKRAAQVQAWVAKRPAGSLLAKSRKRTPFTLKRTGALILGGVKNTVFKKSPASQVFKRPMMSIGKRPACK
jgi:hypothetical protein